MNLFSGANRDTHPEGPEELPEESDTLPDSLNGLPEDAATLSNSLNGLPEDAVALSNGLNGLPEDAAALSEEPEYLPGEIPALPGELSALYEVQSCLKYSEQSATYLLRERSAGKPCLLKTAEDPIYAKLLENERDVLEFIHQSDTSWIGESFSHSVYLEEHAGTTYYIRSYIEGSTLEELCETGYRKPGLPPAQALNYAIALTELLQFLHSLNPPLIHRDIKPQNVIVDSMGNCHFIDLGISRFFQPEKDTDTFIMGTRLTAPPEQFGYRQTDMRSDLYSLGILLFYCITGEYEVTEEMLGELSPQLRHIVRKATMFDPNGRYQTASELMSDLLAARYPDVQQVHRPNNNRTNRLYQGALAALALLCVMLTVLQAGSRLSGGSKNKEPARNAETAETVYSFAEPLIEDAVRLQLNIPVGDITTADLARVNSLHIFGLQIYGSDNELSLRCDSPWFFDDETREAGEYLKTGSISSLEDIRHMPNLTSLSLYRQQISDISALEGLPIVELGIGWNPLLNLEPLRGSQTIQSLCLSDLQISDASVLGTLPNLSTLEISGTKITSLEALANCNITTLNIYDVPLSDYSQLEMFRNLHSLETNILTTDIIAHLTQLPLTELTSAFSSIRSLDDLSVLSGLEILNLGGDNNVLTFDEPKLGHLQNLLLDWMVLPDFHGLSSLKMLTTLSLFNTDCQSYDGLDELPALQEITCTAEQRSAICERYPDNVWLFH